MPIRMNEGKDRCVHVYMCIYVHICGHMYIYIYMDVYVHVYVCIYVCSQPTKRLDPLWA